MYNLIRVVKLVRLIGILNFIKMQTGSIRKFNKFLDRPWLLYKMAILALTSSNDTFTAIFSLLRALAPNKAIIFFLYLVDGTRTWIKATSRIRIK